MGSACSGLLSPNASHHQAGQRTADCHSNNSNGEVDPGEDALEAAALADKKGRVHGNDYAPDSLGNLLTLDSPASVQGDPLSGALRLHQRGVTARFLINFLHLISPASGAMASAAAPPATPHSPSKRAAPHSKSNVTTRHDLPPLDLSTSEVVQRYIRPATAMAKCSFVQAVLGNCIDTSALLHASQTDVARLGESLPGAHLLRVQQQQQQQQQVVAHVNGADSAPHQLPPKDPDPSQATGAAQQLSNDKKSRTGTGVKRLYFVSHAWSCSFTTLVSMLVTHCKAVCKTAEGIGPDDVAYWIDIFALDQSYRGPYKARPDSEVERVIIHHARNVVLLLAGPQHAPAGDKRRSLDQGRGPGPSPKPQHSPKLGGTPHLQQQQQQQQPSVGTGVSAALAQAAAVFASIIGDPKTESGAGATGTHLVGMATWKEPDASSWRAPPALGRAWCLYELLISILAGDKPEVLFEPAIMQHAIMAVAKQETPLVYYQKYFEDRFMACHTTIDFETAVASIPEDQELIRRRVAKHYGLVAANRLLRKAIQEHTDQVQLLAAISLGLAPEVTRLMTSSVPTRFVPWVEAAFVRAAYQGHTEVLRTLLMRGMRLAPGVLGSALGKAVVAYRWEAAQALLSSGADGNSPVLSSGGGVLHALCEAAENAMQDPFAPDERARVEHVKECAEFGRNLVFPGSTVNVNQRDKAGATPLHLAAHSLSPHMVHFLLQSGADVNAADNQGRKPLDMVMKAFKEQAVVFEDWDLKDNFGEDWDVGGKEAPNHNQVLRRRAKTCLDLLKGKIKVVAQQ